MSENRYDSSDIVRRVFLMNAGGLKFASYRVRNMAASDLGVESFSTLQHHLTYVPTTSMGKLGDNPFETVMVNEIGATIYAMLDDAQVDHLRVVVERVEAEPPTDTKTVTFTDPGGALTVIQVYPHPEAGNLEFQVWRGAQLMALISLSIAKMICTLAQQAKDGPGRAGDTKPRGAEEIAGEVGRALAAPREVIDPKSLDTEAG